MEQMGYVFYTQTLILFASLILTFGRDKLIMKVVGEEPSSIYLKEFFNKNIVKIKLSFCILLFVIVLLFSPLFLFLNYSSYQVIDIISISILIFSLLFSSINLAMSGLFKGIKKPLMSCFMEPGFTLAMSCVFLYLITALSGDAAYPMLNVVLVYFISLIITYYFGVRFCAASFRKSKTKYLNSSKLEGRYIQSSKDFFLIAITTYIFSISTTLIAPLNLSMADLALFKVCMQISITVSFVLIVINTIIPPFISENFFSNNIVLLKKIVRASSFLSLIFSLPLVLLIIIFPENILLLFGADFVVASEFLIFLCLGQLINVCCGPVFLLLTLTDNQRSVKILLLVVNACCLIIFYFFTKFWGLHGAVLAQLITTIVQNVSGLILCRIKLGFYIYPTFDLNVIKGLR
ncbi:hypothetical protein TUM4249_40210 [Shewanella sp. KT0246]|nr:hypothetical protein TUM4249_40210 [Shewanella sp. KT0246]